EHLLRQPADGNPEAAPRQLQGGLLIAARQAEATRGAGLGPAPRGRAGAGLGPAPRGRAGAGLGPAPSRLLAGLLAPGLFAVLAGGGAAASRSIVVTNTDQLERAVASAAAGATIELASGIYAPAHTLNLHADVTLTGSRSAPGARILGSNVSSSYRADLVSVP